MRTCAPGEWLSLFLDFQCIFISKSYQRFHLFQATDVLYGKLLDCSCRVRTPATLLFSLSYQYTLKWYELCYHPIYGLDSSTVFFCFFFLYKDGFGIKHPAMFDIPHTATARKRQRVILAFCHCKFIEFTGMSREVYLLILVYNTLCRINEITTLRKSSKHCVRHTEQLISCFDLIRFHQQFIQWSPPLEIEPVTTEYRAPALPLSLGSTSPTGDVK